MPQETVTTCDQCGVRFDVDAESWTIQRSAPKYGMLGDLLSHYSQIAYFCSPGCIKLYCVERFAFLDRPSENTSDQS
jgi:hypothetical protein